MNLYTEIIIKEQNREKIEKLLGQVQGKATARIILNYQHILEIIEGVENRIGPITKKALEGTQVFYDFRQSFPQAYKYTAESTHMTLRYSKGEWRLVRLTRFTCPNMTAYYPYELRLSNTAKEAILRRYE